MILNSKLRNPRLEHNTVALKSNHRGKLVDEGEERGKSGKEET